MNKGSKNMEIVQRGHHDSDESNDEMENDDMMTRMREQMEIRINALKNYEALPVNVKRRVHALKNYRLEVIKMEENFFKELSLLEARFADQYQVIYNKRIEIVVGKREPTEDEAQYDSDSVDDLGEELNEKVSINNSEGVVAISSDMGIPDFWLTVLSHSDMIRANIQEQDIDLLKHLIDIKCVLKCGEQNGFVLEFYFSPNAYFTDEKLTKQYFVELEVSKTCPMNYDGPEIIRTEGCKIHWCPGKNVTVKTVKKVQKSKNKSEKRTVTKVVKNDSFFNFFDPPTESLDSDADVSSDIENILDADFEMGQYIRERIIPRAVTYYTGEDLDDEFEDGMDDDEEDEDDDDCEHSEGDCNGHSDAKPECKQQ